MEKDDSPLSPQLISAYGLWNPLPTCQTVSWWPDCLLTASLVMLF